MQNKYEVFIMEFVAPIRKSGNSLMVRLPLKQIKYMDDLDENMVVRVKLEPIGKYAEKQKRNLEKNAVYGPQSPQLMVI